MAYAEIHLQRNERVMLMLLQKMLFYPFQIIISGIFPLYVSFTYLKAHVTPYISR